MSFTDIIRTKNEKKTTKMKKRETIIAVLDANVLFPYRKRDTLLRFSQARIFQPRWTEQIIHEWTRNLLFWKPQLESSLISQLHAMRKHFPDALVTGYEPLMLDLDLPDPDDRHVLAAAIHCRAKQIVTDNLSDFPVANLENYKIEALSADEFLERLFFHHRAEAIAVLRNMRAEYNKPAFSPSEFTQDLIINGLPRLASRLNEHRADL